MTFLAWPGGWEGGVDERREWREGESGMDGKDVQENGVDWGRKLESG